MAIAFESTSFHAGTYNIMVLLVHVVAAVSKDTLGLIKYTFSPVIVCWPLICLSFIFFFGGMISHAHNHQQSKFDVTGEACFVMINW